jgi:site-specific DNA recombinase
MKAIVYARVSTNEQSGNGSLPTQFDACRWYAEQHGLAVVGEFQDVMSGAKLNRPGLTKVRELIRIGDVDAIIVYCTDRLTRNLAHSLLLRDECKAAGIILHCVIKGISQDTPEGSLFEDIEPAFSEFERLKMKERVVRGKNRVAEEGHIPGDGRHAPYGYRFEGERKTRQMVIVPTCADVVARIFGWYIEGVGIEAIRQRLESEGTPTPEDVGIVVGKPRRLAAGVWIRSTIYRILKNETYTGVFRTRGSVVAVPAIVDRAIYEAVQHKLAIAREKVQKSTKRQYLLRCRIRCTCGAAYSGYTTVSHWRNKRYEYRYYRCIATCRSVQIVHKCASQQVKADNLEATIWNWIANVVLKEDRLRAAITEHQLPTDDKHQWLDTMKSRYYEQRAKVDAELRRLYERFAKGKLTDDELDGLVDSRKAMLQSIDTAIVEIDAQLNGLVLSRNDAEELIQQAQLIHSYLDTDPTYETKVRILDLLDLRVLIAQEENIRIADVSVRLTQARMIFILQNDDCWSPLARGFLAGNRRREDKGETSRAKTDDFAHSMYYQDSDFAVVDRVVELAERREVKPAQIALAWLLHQPGVTAPIIGASKMPQLDEAIQAIKITLSAEELAALQEPYQPHRVLGHS